MEDDGMREEKLLRFLSYLTGMISRKRNSRLFLQINKRTK